jgi:hypothetical protein
MSDHDDDRNGSRPSMHPEAIEALATETAAKQSADERWIDQVDKRTKELHESLDDFREGRTEWQQSVTRQLMRMTDQLQVLMLSRFVWPSLAALGVLFLGGFAASLTWLVATHH